MDTLYDKLESIKFQPDLLTDVLIQIDSSLEYLHHHGYCVYDFDPKKIYLVNDKIVPNSFSRVLNNINVHENMAKINIFQASKIGILSYNNMEANGIINQEHFNFIRDNLSMFNQHDNIPEDIYEYYEEVFLNLNVDYLNNYLLKKKQEKEGNSNTNTFRKVLATDIGRAFVDKNENAFLNVLFIPSIIALTYILSLILYVFIFD